MLSKISLVLVFIEAFAVAEEGKTENIVGGLMQFLDKDADGVLILSEFTDLAGADGLSKEFTVNQLKLDASSADAMFTRYDKDGNNKLSADELVAMFGAINADGDVSLTQDEVQAYANKFARKE